MFLCQKLYNICCLIYTGPSVFSTSYLSMHTFRSLYQQPSSLGLQGPQFQYTLDSEHCSGDSLKYAFIYH